MEGSRVESHISDDRLWLSQCSKPHLSVPFIWQLEHHGVGATLKRNNWVRAPKYITKYTKIPLLAFLSLLYENKKNPMKNVTPSMYRTEDYNLWFQVQQSPFGASEACATDEILKLLFMHYFDFWTWMI